jgi:hypothetical protein
MSLLNLALSFLDRRRLLQNMNPATATATNAAATPMAMPTDAPTEGADAVFMAVLVGEGAPSVVV